MRRHAVRATVAVAALSLAVLSSPIQAQDKPSAQELVSDPVKGALLLLPAIIIIRYEYHTVIQYEIIQPRRPSEDQR